MSIPPFLCGLEFTKSEPIPVLNSIELFGHPPNQLPQPLPSFQIPITKQIIPTKGDMEIVMKDLSPTSLNAEDTGGICESGEVNMKVNE